MRMILMGLAAACAISASPIGGAAGQPFRDCPRCPEMVAVPTGTITIGSPENEERAGPREDQVAVTISRPFAVGRFAATRDEFAAFVSATGHKPGRGCYALAGDDLKRQPEGSWLSPGFAQDGRHPVVCFAWHDAKAYVAWLTARTGKAYRLLSEAEREYVTRAGTTTPFWWGATISTDRANYNGTVPYGDVASGEWRMATVPVDSFAAPPWGFHGVHGNAWDWTEDCWNATNAGNPGDGTARLTRDYSLRVIRGASWNNFPHTLRSARRGREPTGSRMNGLGFRVAREL